MKKKKKSRKEPQTAPDTDIHSDGKSHNMRIISFMHVNAKVIDKMLTCNLAMYKRIMHVSKVGPSSVCAIDVIFERQTI